MDTIILENVNKSFGSNCVVSNLSIRCPRKAIYGFLGPNGAGKTTTLRMIMNILYPDSGNISICSKGYKRNARRNIGYLPEERGLYQKMTVMDMLLYIAALKGMKGGKTDEILRWMDILGFSTRSE